MEKTIPLPEIEKRISKFQAELSDMGIEGALIVQKADLYYFSGTDQECHMWVPAQGAPVLMVKRSLHRAKEACPLEHIIPLRGLHELPGFLRHYHGHIPDTIGMELDVVPAKLFFNYRDLLAPAHILDVSKTIRSIRMVKSEYEISQIKHAAQMADKMFAYAQEILGEVKTENELGLKLEAFLRNQGHPGISRTRGFNMECHYGHILAGPAGAKPSAAPGPTGGTGLGPFYSQGASMSRIRQGEPVVVDYTASVMGYLSDQARTFCLGQLPTELADAHYLMIEVTEMITKAAKPGTVAGELYEKAVQLVENAGFSKGFMGYPDPVPFVAHGVGLELDEWPIIGQRSNTILVQGMVMALEPKVVFPGKGVVGIENTVVVTEYGLEKLNKFPEEICQV